MKVQKHKLKFTNASSSPQVKSWNPRVTSSNPRVPNSNPRVTSSIYELQLQIYELVSSSNPRITSSNPRVTSSNPRIIKSMKTQVNSLNCSSFPTIISPKLFDNLWGNWYVEFLVSKQNVTDFSFIPLTENFVLFF